jgi:AcrR family transcriptional regulator
MEKTSQYWYTSLCSEMKKVRPYKLKRRAESQAETRRRIVEAAVDLHGAVGPASTTISMIAEKAGVQRHTLYSHFPDERSILMACSGHVMERDPLPDAEAWRALKTPAERLSAGLSAIYGWFARNAEVMSSVLRDAEGYEPVRDIVQLRMGPTVARYGEVLGAGLKAKQRAMLTLALSFATWRTLTRDAGMKRADAVKAMVGAIVG